MPFTCELIVVVASPGSTIERSVHRPVCPAPLPAPPSALLAEMSITRCIPGQFMESTAQVPGTPISHLQDQNQHQKYGGFGGPMHHAMAPSYNSPYTNITNITNSSYMVVLVGMRISR
jgi:hypothetical protein